MPPLRRHLLVLVALLAAFAASPASAQTLGDDIDVEGPITALDSSSLTVGGLTFAVTPQTDIHDDNDQPVAFGDLTVGLYVDVEGYEDADGDLIATEIEVEEDEDEDGDEIEAEGLVLARTDSSVTVGGLTFGVTAATRVVNDDDVTIPYSDITVGLRVKVDGRLLADGALVATEIEIDDEDDGDDDNDLEVEGLITALSADALTVNGRVFALTAATVVVGNDDEPLTLDDLAVGLRVEVDGRYDATGTLVASRVELEDFADDELELTGLIEALSDSSLTVSGTLFDVTAQTLVLDNNRLPILFSDLALGQTVEVRSLLTAEGRRVATHIKLEDAATADDEIVARAALDAVTDSVAVVLGRPFVLTPTTRLLGLNNEPITLDALPIGQSVEIRARRDADGRLLALVIEREDNPATSVRLRADVTAVSADSISVLGVAFNAATASVLGLDGQPTVLDSVLVGQTVEVTGTASETGFVATLIQVLRAAQATGRVADAAPGEFALPGVTVATTGATLFVDETGAVVSADAVTAGATVRATGTLGADGRLAATRVTVLAESAVVAGEAAPEAALAMEAPFPNPAVQGATVRYTLGTSATVAVEVLDALGRTVLRLDRGALAAGRHEARLDTARLSAGLYLVRLSADGRPVASRTLTVVR